MGRRAIPSRLRELGFRVIAHDDRFSPDAQDEEWLAAAGREGWIAVTHPDLASGSKPENARS